MSLGDWIEAEVAHEVGEINRQVLSRARRELAPPSIC